MIGGSLVVHVVSSGKQILFSFSSARLYWCIGSYNDSANPISPKGTVTATLSERLCLVRRVTGS
jgi:hypothetical protein